MSESPTPGEGPPDAGAGRAGRRWAVAAAVLSTTLAVGAVTFAASAVATGTAADATPLLSASTPRGARVLHATRVTATPAQPPARGASVSAANAVNAGNGAGLVGSPATDGLPGGIVEPAVAALPPAWSTLQVNPWSATTLALPDGPTAPVLTEGDRAPEVVILKRRLAELGYRPSTDETLSEAFTSQTWSAVLAFQKAENLERTGDVDAATWARLRAPQAWSVTPVNVYPRVEVDIERQIVLVVLGPADVRTLNTSTGGGYTYRNEYGGLEVAETPIGDYRVYSVYDGWVKAPLGTLYRPLYFEGGYAIHGSPYVPSFPDSHGCVRLSNSDMDWLFDLAPRDMPVGVYETMNPLHLFGLTPLTPLAPTAAPPDAMPGS